MDRAKKRYRFDQSLILYPGRDLSLSRDYLEGIRKEKNQKPKKYKQIQRRLNKKLKPLLDVSSERSYNSFSSQKEQSLFQLQKRFRERLLENSYYKKAALEKQRQIPRVQLRQSRRKIVCRKCKCILFGLENILGHVGLPQNGVCDLIFVKKVPWIKLNCMGSSSLILCPNPQCITRIGEATSQEMHCLCGHSEIPAFAVFQKSIQVLGFLASK